MSRLTDAVHVYISSRGMTEEEYLQKLVEARWESDAESARASLYSEAPSIAVGAAAEDVLSLNAEEAKRVYDAGLADAAARRVRRLPTVPLEALASLVSVLVLLT